MAKPIEMQDPAGAKATAYVGVNLPILVFGPLPALFRGHLSAFAIMVAVVLGAAYLVEQEFGEKYGMLAAGVLWVVYAVTYNSWHRSWLISRGYRVVDEPRPKTGGADSVTYMRENSEGTYSTLPS